jgi:hypothetical protein
MKNKSRQTAFVITLFALLLSAASHAQNSRGSLRGTVQDATGARIASAKIVAQLSGSSVQRSCLSEERGEFRLDDLFPRQLPHHHQPRVLRPAQADVAIAVTTVRDITVTMKPAPAFATVNVQGSSSSITTEIIDTSSAVRGGVVGSQDLETLPLPARSFANIAYLVPGTEPVEPSDPTKARITAVSTGGSSGLNNELSVDGAENSDDWIGGFLQNFSPDGVQEFAVRTSNEDADTGWTTAGSVVITTKRGTNEWHGSAAFFDRQAALNARFPIENPAPNPKQPFLPPELCGNFRRSHRERQSLVLHLIRKCPRKREHRLQPRQHHSIRRAVATGIRGIDHRHSLYPGSQLRPDSLPRLPQFAALRLGAVAEIDLVPARIFRQLPHPQRAGAAGHAAIDRTDHAQQLLERRAQQYLCLQSNLAGQFGRRRQLVASHADAEFRSRLCHTISLQRDGAHRFRL